MAHKPTAEQVTAVDYFRTGEDVKIEAGAGAGKTSTLLLFADVDRHRIGQYVAFNRALVDEAGEKFPRQVGCNTAHSLAFRAVGRRYAHRLNGPRMPGRELARRLRVDPLDVMVLGTRKRLSSSMLAGLVMRTVGEFCKTADPAPAEKHFPYLEGIDEPTPDGRRGWANNKAVRRALMPALGRAWADLMSERGALPFQHAHYLKAWQLGDPYIPADYVLYDEAQDANPVTMDIVRRQTHAQKVWVGDSQQAINEFTGAVNALEQIPAAHTAWLTQSFRFGQPIADVANVALGELDAVLRIRGFDQQPSRVAPLDDPHAVLCRTNAATVTRFLEAQQAGRRPHLVGGGTEVLSFAKGALDLQRDGWSSHPDLACFTSWGLVQQYVAEDQLGGELRLLVDLVDTFGAEKITTGLARMPREDDADLVISTAHKSKGREWPTVQLGDDFPAEALNPGDWRLLYVAATRARGVLDLTRVSAFAAAGYVPGESTIEPAEEGVLVGGLW